MARVVIDNNHESEQKFTSPAKRSVDQPTSRPVTKRWKYRDGGWDDSAEAMTVAVGAIVIGRNLERATKVAGDGGDGRRRQEEAVSACLHDSAM